MLITITLNKPGIYLVEYLGKDFDPISSPNIPSTLVQSSQANTIPPPVPTPIPVTVPTPVPIGTIPITLQDYEVVNSNQVAIYLAGGVTGQSVNIQLKQLGIVVGTTTAAYSNTMAVESSAFGYCDVFADGIDLGGIYIPEQISGTWRVQKAKAVNETQTMNLEFTKVGGMFIIGDRVPNNGWPNVEYWHNSTFLGSSIPNNYNVEPNVIHHLTKKRWAQGSWIGSDDDGVNKQKSQLTFKITADDN